MPQEEFNESEIREGLYFIRGALIEIPYFEKDSCEGDYRNYEGKLGLRFIAPSQRNLKGIAKLLKLPFSKQVVLPYSFGDK